MGSGCLLQADSGLSGVGLDGPGSSFSFDALQYWTDLLGFFDQDVKDLSALAGYVGDDARGNC